MRTRTFDVVVEPPRDSDGDGLYDVIEIWLDCDPHDDDTDDDGIGDRVEVLLGTSPTEADSDRMTTSRATAPTWSSCTVTSAAAARTTTPTATAWSRGSS